MKNKLFSNPFLMLFPSFASGACCLALLYPSGMAVAAVLIWLTLIPVIYFMTVAGCYRAAWSEKQARKSFVVLSVASFLLLIGIDAAAFALSTGSVINVGSLFAFKLIWTLISGVLIMTHAAILERFCYETGAKITVIFECALTLIFIAVVNPLLASWLSGMGLPWALIIMGSVSFSMMFACTVAIWTNEYDTQARLPIMLIWIVLVLLSVLTSIFVLFI